MQKNISLKRFNAFHVESTAKYFVRIEDEKDLTKLLKDENYEKMRMCVLGESSGVLFAKGFDGLVIKIDLKGINISKEDSRIVVLEVGAGEIWDNLVSYAIKNNYQGIENMSGIPGTVGAAPVQNIAAYGQNFEDIFVSLKAVELDTGIQTVFDKPTLEFGYRDSVFKNKNKDKFVITKVTIKLNKVGDLDLTYHSRYDSLKDELSRFAKPPYKLADIRRAVLNIRSKKFPNWKVQGNTGSFFKNPIVDKKTLSKIKEKYPDVQYYPVDKLLYTDIDDSSDYVKIAAGWLLDELGWKGKRIGNVGTSPNQALVIVNYGSATAEEIIAFSKKMQEDFKKNFGVELEHEVRII